MSRTSKTLMRLGVPTLAAATMLGGVPAFLVGSAQAAAGDTLTLTPATSSASTGTCREYTATVKNAAGAATTSPVTVVVTERTPSGQGSTETLDVDFCSVTGGNAFATGPAETTSNDTNETDTARFIPDGDGVVTFGLAGTTSSSTGAVDILGFVDSLTTGTSGVAEANEAQATAALSITQGGTPVVNAADTNLFQPSDTASVNNSVASIDAAPDSATFFPIETVTVSVTAKNAAGDTLAGVRPSADVVSGPNEAASPVCSSTNNDGVATCSYTARNTGTFLGSDRVLVYVNEFFDGTDTDALNDNTTALDANESSETVTRVIAARPVGTVIDVTAGTAASARTTEEDVLQQPSTTATGDPRTETFSAKVVTGDAKTPVSGVIVRFTVTSTGAGTETVSPVDAVTDANGVAITTLTDTNGVEDEVVTVVGTVRGQVDTAADDARLTYNTAASSSSASVSLTPETTSTQAGNFREFIATARNINGELVPGATVTVTISGVGRLANSTRQTTLFTGAAGTVRFETTSATNETGTQTVTAEVTGAAGTTASRTDVSTNTITAASPAPTTSASPTTPATTSPTATPTTGTTPTPTGTVSPPPGTVCVNPAGISLSRAFITPGIPVTVTVTAPAGADVELQAYSRPSTTYGQVRRSVVGSTGRISFDVTPGTNTRIFAACVGQANSASASQVINVRTALSLTVVRNGTRNYTFQGRILPRRAGQLITLYRVTNDGTRVLTSQLKTDSTGTYRVNRRFTGSGTFGFLTRTGQTLTNAAGESNTPQTTAGVNAGRGVARPTAIF